MAKFEQQKYNDYLKRNDYLGLSEYLYSFKFNDKRDQKEMDSHAEYFRQFGTYANGMLARANDKPLLSFYFQSKFGVYDNSNPYYTQMQSIIDNAFNYEYINANGDENTANSPKIRFTIDNANAFNSYKNDFVAYNIKFDDENIKHTYAGGNNIIEISRDYAKNNPIDFINLLTIFNKNTGEYYYTTPYAYGNGISSKQAHDYAPSFEYLDSLGNPVTVHRRGANGASIVKSDSYYNSFRLNDQNLKFTHVASALREYNTFISNAEKEMDNALPDTATQKFNLVYTGFMCEAQGQLVKAYSEGKLKREYVNGVMKDIDDYYKNALYHLDLNQYDEVYATNGDPNVTDFSMTEAGKRGVYNEMIKDAIDKGKIEYASGMANGRSGTIITINNYDEEGKETGAHIQLFVPGLFEEDIAKVQSNMTDITAMQEYQRHQDYQYGYDLVDGGSITQFADAGVEIVRDGVASYISKENAQKLIERDIELRHAARLIQREVTDDNGELKKITQASKQMVEVATNNIADDIYGFLKDTDLEQYKAEREKIYRYLASIIGFQINNKNQ